MRVLARGTLYGFVRNRLRPAQRQLVMDRLDAWYEAVIKASWKNSAELKEQYRSASVISAERVVFNIKGNVYRLIVAFNCDAQLVMVKWLGTHVKYDAVDASQVSFAKERYADPANSNEG